jgi:hypothetical protein
MEIKEEGIKINSEASTFFQLAFLRAAKLTLLKTSSSSCILCRLTCCVGVLKLREMFPKF